MRQSIGLHYEQSRSVILVIAGFLLAGCHGSGDNPAGKVGNQSALGTCADPIVLEGSETLNGQTTSQAADAVSGDDPSCVGYATHGTERVYRVTVPAKDKTKLHIAVSPTDKPSADAFDPVVYMTDNCVARPTCSAGKDIRGGGGQESLDFVNTSDQDKNLYVVVDGYDFQPNGGGFTLAAELTP